MVSSPQRSDGNVKLTQVVDYQLGNGKRSSLAVPQHIPQLIQRAAPDSAIAAREAALSSGTVSYMLEFSDGVEHQLILLGISNAAFSTAITSG
jgi:hypothetical protein